MFSFHFLITELKDNTECVNTVHMYITGVHTVAFEASEDRTSVLREVLSATEPEPTAESSVPTSSSSFSCAYKSSRENNQ